MGTNFKPAYSHLGSVAASPDEGTLCRQPSAIPGTLGLSLGSTPFSRTKILEVPYYTQPTSVHCQSTVLRMYAEYLEESVLGKSTGAGTRSIQEIWNDINTGKERPVQDKNNHANMLWWLGKYFKPMAFGKVTTKDFGAALDTIVRSIDDEYPLMASVSHSTNQGHIILIIGYENYRPEMCMPGDNMSHAPAVQTTKIVVHDPFGAYDPHLGSKLFGKGRWTGGQSQIGGGESGPGEGVRLPMGSVNRRTFSRIGNFELMTVKS